MKRKWIIILSIILLAIIIITVYVSVRRNTSGATAERKIEETMTQQYTFDDVNELEKIVLKNRGGSIYVEKK